MEEVGWVGDLCRIVGLRIGSGEDGMLYMCGNDIYTARDSQAGNIRRGVKTEGNLLLIGGELSCWRAELVKKRVKDHDSPAKGCGL